MSEIVSIIMPTYDNPQYLAKAVQSLVTTRCFEDLLHIYIVDNGTTKVKNYLPEIFKPFVTIIEAGQNLGWEGGLKEGLKYVPKDTQFVCFANDDIFIPRSSLFWLSDMLQWFRSPTIGAVGPTSNTVMGVQNIFAPYTEKDLSVEFLIGFCLLLRKDALIKAGGIDDTLPGGDDLDLSIRLKDKGYNLICDRRVFVYHHGFKTGERVNGNPNEVNGWNSYEMWQKTNTALIKKHGFARWQRLMENQVCSYVLPKDYEEKGEDKIIKSLVEEGERVFDLGCGGNKTVPFALGFDMVPKGKQIFTLNGFVLSQGDVTADVSKPLPEKDADTIIARHILEHMINPLEALSFWKDALKPGGKLIIAVPDERQKEGIPVNREHKHAFTPESLAYLLKTLGFTKIEEINSHNYISFIMTARKGEK